jgi:hypothetical protein
LDRLGLSLLWQSTFSFQERKNWLQLDGQGELMLSNPYGYQNLVPKEIKLLK